VSSHGSAWPERQCGEPNGDPRRVFGPTILTHAHECLMFAPHPNEERHHASHHQHSRHKR